MGKSNSKQLEVVGLDLGDRWTSWCHCAAGGEVVGEGRVRTQQAAFSRQFGAEPRRILLETGTHSLWVARHLRSMGHEVYVLHARSLRAITDIVMLFVRCKGGISHNPAEAISPADAETGARVLLRFIEAFGPR